MTEFGRYLKRCPAALKDKTRTLSLLKDALNNDLPKFRVLQAAYELGILEAIQRGNPISTDDRLKITTGLVSQYAMLENAAKNAIDYWQDSIDVDILYRAFNDADECRESRINSAESTAQPATPIKPQQNPAENLLKIESISQDSIRMGIRLQWKKQSEIECYEIWRAKESEQPVKIKEGSFPIPRYQDYDVEANCCYTYAIRGLNESQASHLYFKFESCSLPFLASNSNGVCFLKQKNILSRNTRMSMDGQILRSFLWNRPCIWMLPLRVERQLNIKSGVSVKIAPR